MNVAHEDPFVGEPGVDYRRRRDEIAARAAGPGRSPTRIRYTPAENEVWRTVRDALDPVWDRNAARAALAGRDRLDLRRDRVPQLVEINDRLTPVSGFRFEAVPGLVDPIGFFAALADQRFLSTQYVRWEGRPLYTPEPDVIHEVLGHAHLLASPPLAELHRLAGAAMRAVGTAAARQFVADVFWFSAEFGVVREGGRWKACGAGLLSSIGELRWFADNARVLPLDIAGMGATGYDITRYQPVLFGADSIEEILEVVGGFFATCTDAVVADLMVETPHHPPRAVTSPP